MALSPVFHARVLPGGLLVLNRPKDYAKHVRTFSGQYVEVIVRKRREKRSLDLNAYWHAVPFPLLQEALGYDSVADLKLALMGECWGYQRDRLTGRDLPIKAHTSELTNEEGARFTEWLVRFGATLPSPVMIPLPNEVAA